MAADKVAAMLDAAAAAREVAVWTALVLLQASSTGQDPVEFADSFIGSAEPADNELDCSTIAAQAIREAQAMRAQATREATREAPERRWRTTRNASGDLHLEVLHGGAWKHLLSIVDDADPDDPTLVFETDDADGLAVRLNGLDFTTCGKLHEGLLAELNR